MTKKQTKKKKGISYISKKKPGRRKLTFCEKCGFEETWACQKHGCGSEERVGEKSEISKTKRWRW
ncbi:MAG: hypothetical protein ABEI74_04705 [Candidatus Pacearchaeota archaeon]